MIYETSMIEFTLNPGEAIHIGEHVIIMNIPKDHYLAIHAKVIKIGINAPREINIRRGELKNLYAL